MANVIIPNFSRLVFLRSLSLRGTELAEVSKRPGRLISGVITFPYRLIHKHRVRLVIIGDDSGDRRLVDEQRRLIADNEKQQGYSPYYE